MPLSSGADLYDMAYTYGTKGDGRNGAGRITQVIQGQGFKTDLLRYDELGNIVDENTTIDVPLYGYKGFTTTKRYDSFGRILQATYPDGDQVTYGYTALGELHTIDSKVGGTTQSIVSGILYNGYGQISKLSYGNGTYTDYDYNVSGSGASALKKNTLFKTTTTAKEQGATSQSTVLERNYTYNTQGMVTQLDRDVAGTLMNSSAGTTVPLSEKYSYDAFGRFDTHQHAIGGSTEYTLDMTYNKAGGIVKKDALATGITNFQDLNYTLNYNYSASNPHQLVDVIDSKSGAQSYYQYNSSGSIQEIQDHAAKGPQSFFWNEEQWLSGVRNDLGVHHYVYDHKGERVMKSSVMHSSVQVNDKNIDDVQYLEPYTLYINPYYVVTELQGGDKVSKHYYMNTQRVATDISINYQAQESMAGPQQPNARDPKKPSEDTASVNYNAAFADLQATLNALGHQKIDVNGLGQQPTLEEYYPELVRETALNTTAAKNAPESTTRVLFWYHPDYLGNVDLVTERDGKTYEFFTYNPWGEEMHQYNANTFGFSSPYRFNSKEKDEETGLHYYGARYYQSKLSVWMSVDPKAHMAPDWTPYRFGFANPLLYTDPDGKFESPEKAREFAKANGIDGQILEYDNGTFALHDSQNGISYQQKSSGQVIQSVLLDPVDVIYENSSAHQDNDGVPEMNPDLSFGASIVTTEVGGAAELTISELGEKAAGQGLKTLAKSANFAGGVIGTVDNGIQAYNDYQKGNYGRSAVNGLQGAAYTTGTVMLFTPLAPVGGIILLSATISDWIQMGVEYQTGNTNY
jgi:RHS repeat-associated protein